MTCLQALRAICIFLLILCCGQDILSQERTDFEGSWAGDLIKSPYDIPISLNIYQKKGSLKASFDNPAQGVKQYVIDSVWQKEDSLFLVFGDIRINLSIGDSTLQGSVRQNDNNDRVLLVKNGLLRTPKRPQTPVGPFPYRSDTVRFASMQEGIKMEGTLTQPANGKKGKAAILLTGSGPQNRDEEILGHRLFAVLADHLTRNGITVLRFDDRGMGNSEGIHGTASSFDFAMDAAGAYQFLMDKGYRHVGFIGHSEGGIIAQIADSLVNGSSFHVYLAGPGLSISDLMVEQNRLVLESSYPDSLLSDYLALIADVFNSIKSGLSTAEKQEHITSIASDFYNAASQEEQELLAPSQMAFSMRFTQLLYLNWWKYFLSYEPVSYLRQIKAPILAINGSEDIQVTPDNLEAIAAFATNSTEVTTQEIKDMNHLFQECITCSLREYGLITQTIMEEPLEFLTKWILYLSIPDNE